MVNSFEEQVVNVLYLGSAIDDQLHDFDILKAIGRLVTTILHYIPINGGVVGETENPDLHRFVEESASLIAVVAKRGEDIDSKVNRLISNAVRRNINEISPQYFVEVFQSVLRVLKDKNCTHIEPSSIKEYLKAAITYAKDIGYSLCFVNGESVSYEADANELFYNLLFRRIKKVRQLVYENRRLIEAQLVSTNQVHNIAFAPLKHTEQKNSLVLLSYDNLSKKSAHKNSQQVPISSIHKVKRLPNEYFTWIPLKSNFKVNVTDVKNEPMLAPYLSYETEETAPSVSENQIDYYDEAEMSSLNWDIISLSQKLFVLTRGVVDRIFKYQGKSINDYPCSYRSVCQDTYMPQETFTGHLFIDAAPKLTVEWLFQQMFFVQKSDCIVPSGSNLSHSDMNEDLNLGQNLRKWFCRKCYMYTCRQHFSSEMNLPASYYEQAYEVNGLPVIPTPCSKQCFVQSNCILSLNSSNPIWNAEDIVCLENFIRVFGNNWCDLSTLFFGQKSCYDCAFFAQGNNDMSKERNGRRNGQRKKSQKSRKIFPIKVVDHLPCSHEGQCNLENCSCMQNKLPCEKYCPCYLLEKGRCSNCSDYCNCKFGQCSDGHCPCFPQNRECDPDRCGCFSKVRSAYGSSGDRNNECKNIGLLTRAHKRLFISHSDYHKSGWGLFTRDNIEKDAFVCEYKGELITLEESERRAQIYELTGMIFFFDKGDEIIDATRKGGKARFANDPRNAPPNCYARYKRTIGDVKVGIYAARDIQAGEELLFEYKLQNS
eukprot:jgi/Galph1/707/GphlegSOOS_G5490.1